MVRTASANTKKGTAMVSRKWACTFVGLVLLALMSWAAADGSDAQTFKSRNGLRFTFDGITFGVTPMMGAPSLPLDGRRILDPLDLGDGSKLDVHLRLRWSEKERVFRKWVRFKLTGTTKPKLLEEVILSKINVKDKDVRTFPGTVQSYPCLSRADSTASSSRSRRRVSKATTS